VDRRTLRIPAVAPRRRSRQSILLAPGRPLSSPYGRTVSDVRRQCAFIASVNELEFADVTGNRRFWPVLLAAAIAVEALARDRDQLWAEAAHWYHQGVPWWLTPELEAIARAVQDSHVEADEWDEKIRGFIGAQAAPNNGVCPPFTLRSVLLHLGFDFIPGQMNFARKADEMRAARRLRRLGYRRDPHRVRGTSPLWIPV
jgi:predicted P-loop ATPase